MKLRYLFLSLLVPVLVFCNKPDGTPVDTNEDTPGVNTQDDEEEIAPEIKDGDDVLVTNANIEKFLTDVHYNTHDYSKSDLRTWAADNDVMVCPGTSDRSPMYTIRWAKGSGTVTVTLKEDGREERVYVQEEEYYQNITNLLPNTHYTFEAKDESGKVVNHGQFTTHGKLHHLYLRPNIRNARDMGGWKTEDNKTVKYRLVYRGGRLLNEYLNKAGKKELKYEGIKAQLDLRGHTSSGQQEYLNKEESPIVGIWGDEAEFLAPCVEEGYSQMLRDDKEKTRQCMQFIFDCVDKNKPVYFHCSLGRDRTGTVAMLTLGILGVPEGDISQEYELTQFAPHGYATSSGESVKMLRTVDYKGAANVIWEYTTAPETFQQGVNKYLVEIGISQADIDKFITNMLQ